MKNIKGPILFVDDNEKERNFANACYEKSELPNKIILIESGIHLINHLEKVKAGAEEYPSFILLDVMMPEMDGIATLRKIRADIDFKTDPKIYILSYSDFDQDYQDALKLGANGYIVKSGSGNFGVHLFNSLNQQILEECA